MKIAIVGAGISGLTCAYYLNKAGHDVHVFESNDYMGGHTHTHQIGDYAIDTGFIVFNRKTYPCFVTLLTHLNVATEKTDMSFSVFSPHNKFQYAGGTLNNLFADRRNIVNPQFYKLLFDINRFHRLALNIITENNRLITVSEFLLKYKFNKNLGNYYLYPLISALWSASLKNVADMPMFLVASFMQNHLLLQMIPDLEWEVIKGGSKNYIQPLIKNFASTIYLSTPVIHIIKKHPQILLMGREGELGSFDKCVVAAHSDQALNLLSAPNLLEQDILSKFTYEKNEIILHQDNSQMPSYKRAWASWNYWIHPNNLSQATLTYYMNKLQNLNNQQEFFVTLNPVEPILEEKIIKKLYYAHPQYTPLSLSAQSRQSELNANDKTIYFCGAYWGFGFHEDGVKSALNVCDAILGA